MELKSSSSLAVLLLLLHLLAVCAVFMAALSWPARMAIFLLIFLSLAYYLARDVLLLLPHSWRELSLDTGSVSVVRQDGSRLEGMVAGGSLVCAYFIALGVRSDTRGVPVFRVIFPDAVGQERFRELCVRIRFA
jgi:hypothetical protein